jgi:hypothetical protein
MPDQKPEKPEKPRCYGGTSGFLSSSSCSASPLWRVEAQNRFANTCTFHMGVGVHYVLTGNRGDSAPTSGRATVQPLTREEKEGKA